MTEDVSTDVLNQLEKTLQLAETSFATNSALNISISDRLKDSLDTLHKRSEMASAVFTNIVTCLAIKSARPNADVRYHQTQIQTPKYTDRPAGVNFRGISEDIIYPWLNRNRFDGAKSGWQTRTLERPKPYKLNYDENIAHVKNEFLAIFDEIEEKSQSAFDALVYLIYKQIIRREEVKIALSIPKTKDIGMIVELFRSHFFRPYKGSKGASRLPVLALHAIYTVMVPQLRRYSGKTVLKLHAHSAADSQTGSVGDIEISTEVDGKIFEAVEVKHSLIIDEPIAIGVQTKVMDKFIDRYYILTTHSNCEPDEAAKKIIQNIKSVYNCQVIANGVIPTIRYYFRLLDDPSVVFLEYVKLLQDDKSISHEHRITWNDVVTTLKF
jgi:DNA (cytosine-5)-methyltransferase 1